MEKEERGREGKGSGAPELRSLNLVTLMSLLASGKYICPDFSAFRRSLTVWNLSSLSS